MGRRIKLDQDRSDGQSTQRLGSPQMLPPRKYCPHIPTAKQLAFLLCPRLEAFFGGAAGPGKTDALLMAALQLVERPHYQRAAAAAHLSPTQPVQLHHEPGASVAGEYRRGLERN